MTRRFLSVFLPWFPAERLIASGEAKAGPFALTRLERGRVVVAAVDPRAAALGIAPGMVLADARAIEPGLPAYPHVPEADRAALDRLAGWALRWTPWIALDGPDGLMLEIGGSAHLFGGEAALAEDIRNRLVRFGFSSRLAVADTQGAAATVARGRASDTSIVVVPPGGQAGALDPLALKALRPEREVLDGLARLGIRRIAELRALPRAPLVRRFGEVVLGPLDRALGLVDEPMSPRLPVAPHATRMAFAEPIGRDEDVRAALDRLLAGLAHGLERAGEGARRVVLACHRVDGTAIRLSVGTSRASRDAPALARLFDEKLKEIDAGFGIEVMVAEAPVVEPLTPRQFGLDGRGAGDDRLATLVDRLDNRLGEGTVVRLAPLESHVPERSVVARPPMAPSPATARIWPADRLRPLRLFASPEPVEAVAPIPDEPPVRFTWRGRDHRVVRADGPERIAPEWWRAGPAARTRDYYRIEDESGRRFWLYRDGLYGQDPLPRWFVHGVFS